MHPNRDRRADSAQSEPSVNPPRYHFMSGLPRSGSTLLAAIVSRNPRFHAGMTSPAGGLLD